MLEFIKNNYFVPLYVIVLVVSLIRYRHYYDSVFKYFPILLVYTLLTEILGILVRDNENFQIIYLDKYHYVNYIIYNIYDIFFFLFFYRAFWKILKDKKSKRLVKWGTALFVLTAIINPFFQNVLMFPQIYTASIGSLLLVGFVILYFKEINDDIQKKDNFLLWIGIGLFLFNLFFPFVLLMGRFNYGLYEKLSLQQFHYALIVIMYICFTVAFLLIRGRSLKDNMSN